MSEVREIKLPTKVVESVTQNPSTLIIYSHPKAGKTTLLSKLDNCLILDLEGGSKYVDALKMEVNSLDELQQIGAAIVKAGKPYKYVAIDTLSALEDLCIPYATAMYKQSPMGKTFDGVNVLELAKGAGYFWLRQAWDIWMTKIHKLADHIILIGLLKDSVIDKAGKEVSAKDLDLTGKLKQIVCADADAIGYMYRGSDDSLEITFKSSEQLNCGSRCNHLKGQVIKIADYDKEKNDLVNVQWNKIYLD